MTDPDAGSRRLEGVNLELVERVKAQIRAEAEAFDMTEWEADWGTEADCGTTHCIGGLAIVLSGERVERAITHTEANAIRARQLLGLPNSLLFYVVCWPGWLQDRYCQARYIGKDLAAVTEAACAAIDDYIENGGWQ